LTWRKLLEYCTGEVGLTPAEFWSMSLEEINLACRGYETRMAHLKEIPRLQATLFFNANRRKGTPVMHPEKLFPLYTDRFIKREPLITKEELDDMDELFKRAKWN
jgi:hypothetical protein